MKQSEMKRAPSLGGWVIAAGAGLVAASVTYVVGHLSLPQAGFIGGGILLLVGLVLGMYWGPHVAVTPKAAVQPAPIQKAAAIEPIVAAEVVVEATAIKTTSSGPAAMFTAAPPQPATAAKAAPTAKTNGTSAPNKSAPPKSAQIAAVPKAADAKAPKVKKADGPLRLSAPRKGKADDLKEIEGIGPALEKLCHELGFYHFDQIAGWSNADVAWVDANMKTFKGRIVRDKWIAQSKIILAEGLDVFRVRAKTNDY